MRPDEGEPELSLRARAVAHSDQEFQNDSILRFVVGVARKRGLLQPSDERFDLNGDRAHAIDSYSSHPHFASIVRHEACYLDCMGRRLCQLVPRSNSRAPAVRRPNGAWAAAWCAIGFICACEAHPDARKPKPRDPVRYCPTGSEKGVSNGACPYQPITPCSQGFEVRLERDTDWPTGRYFVRTRVDGGETRICSFEFAPVVGAVIDSCTSAGVTIGYRYDATTRELTQVFFPTARTRVELEILFDESSPPVVELQHDITTVCGELFVTLDGADAGANDGGQLVIRDAGSDAEPTDAAPQDAATPPDAAALDASPL